VAGREEELLQEYYAYDRLVDIVAVAEVWFTKSRGIGPTVQWFERFPRYLHEDGDEVTPEFTVLFADGTALVGEHSSLGLGDESLDELCRQIGRYATLRRVPSAPRRADGTQPLADVSDVDVVLFMPHRVANAGAGRLNAAMEDVEHFYDPPTRPSVIGWSYDDGENSYTFTRSATANNQRPRDHGRDVGLGSWLEGSYDTLRGVPRQFAPFKVRGRFMNDAPPPLYTATVLWAETFKDMLRAEGKVPPHDIETSPDAIAAFMRAQYGFGSASVARQALQFLKTSGLATESGRGWIVRYRELRRTDRETVEALVTKYLAKRPQRTQRASTEREESQEPDETAPTTLFDAGESV
jgi:hypothetical protein